MDSVFPVVVTDREKEELARIIAYAKVRDERIESYPDEGYAGRHALTEGFNAAWDALLSSGLFVTRQSVEAEAWDDGCKTGYEHRESGYDEPQLDWNPHRGGVL